MCNRVISEGFEKHEVVMNESIFKTWYILLFIKIVAIIYFLMIFPAIVVNAQDRAETLQGQVHEFEVTSPYFISGSAPAKNADSLGNLMITGDFETIVNGNDTQYDVKKGDLSVEYKFDKNILHNPGTEWHLI